MIIIGTSGWVYDHWKGRFYPDVMPQRDWLSHFASRFPTVEINNSFYRLPTEDAFRRWRKETPDGFVFAVKASRFVTHIKRLKDGKEPNELFWSSARLLGDKCGPILYQCPPRFPLDAERLELFIRTVPKQVPVAFEFRDRSWETDEVYDILDRHGAAFVYAEWPGVDVPDVVTGGWAYIRFHKGGKVLPGYSRVKLERWADRIAELPARDVYIYFNNDTGGAALRDAAALEAMLAARGIDVVQACAA